jgi:hypothetical protein
MSTLAPQILAKFVLVFMLNGVPVIAVHDLPKDICEADGKTATEGAKSITFVCVPQMEAPRS